MENLYQGLANGSGVCSRCSQGSFVPGISLLSIFPSQLSLSALTKCNISLSMTKKEWDKRGFFPGHHRQMGCGFFTLKPSEKISSLDPRRLDSAPSRSSGCSSESFGSQPGDSCGQVSEGQTALQEHRNTEEILGFNTERKI